MGKHDLQLSENKRRSEVVTPTVIRPSPVPRDAEISEPLKMAFLSGSLEIAKMVVGGQRDIAQINATADGEVRKIAAEIDRITADAKAFVMRIKAESEAWHARFDKESAERRELVGCVLASLEAHPEWSDVIKAKVIDLAIAEVATK